MKAMLFALLAGLGWGVGEIFTKMVLHTGRIGPVTAMAVRSTVALPLFWLAYLGATRWIGPDRWGAWGFRPEPTSWTGAGAPALLKLVLGAGVTAGGLAMLAFYLALGLGEISRVKPVAFSVAPAVAVLLGWLVLGEPMTARKLAGVAFVLAGVVLLTRG